MALYLTLTAFILTLASLSKPDMPARSRGCALNRVVSFAAGTALFCVSALRLSVGNDYDWYRNIMHEALYHGHVPTEEGFNVLVRAIYRFCGFENYLLVFAVFSLVTVWLFLDAFSRYSPHFGISLAMFLLLGLYFQSFSTVRYYAVLPLSLYALRFLERRDIPLFVLTVCAGALFHKSILAVLVIYPLALFPWKKWMAVPAALAGIAVAALPSFWTQVALRLYPTYANVAFDRGTLNLPNILRCVLVLALVYVCEKKLPRREADGRLQAHMRVWTKLTVLGLAFYVCGWFLPQITRIGYYMTLPQLLLVPACLRLIRDEKTAKRMTALVFCFCALYFVRYMMMAGDEGILILPYRSFLFHPAGG